MAIVMRRMASSSLCFFFLFSSHKIIFDIVWFIFVSHLRHISASIWSSTPNISVVDYCWLNPISPLNPYRNYRMCHRWRAMSISFYFYSHSIVSPQTFSLRNPLFRVSLWLESIWIMVIFGPFSKVPPRSFSGSNASDDDNAAEKAEKMLAEGLAETGTVEEAEEIDENWMNIWMKYIWGFPYMGYPNSWMVYSGKSYENGWFRGTPISGNLHVSNWQN